MPTESSAVSRLIHQVHTRRLDTDPLDGLLFESPNIAQRTPARVAPRVDAVASQQTVYPTAPHVPRERTWLLVVASALALALGVGGAAYLVETYVADAPPVATPAPMTAPAQPPTTMAVAPVVEPVLEAPASPPPATEAAPPAPTVAPAPPPPAVRDRAKSKRTTAKRLSKKSIAKTPAVKSEAPPPAPPASRRKGRQAADSENPL